MARARVTTSNLVAATACDQEARSRAEAFDERDVEPTPAREGPVLGLPVGV